jgi:hypothetical protein
MGWQKRAPIVAQSYKRLGGAIAEGILGWEKMMKRKSRKLYQLPEPPLNPERALEMLLHAYNYVRGLDLDGARGAANLLLSHYKELRRKAGQHNGLRRPCFP